MQLLGPLVTTRQAGGYLDLEGGNRICMVLEWTLGLVPSSFCLSFSLVLTSFPLLVWLVLVSDWFVSVSAKLVLFLLQYWSLEGFIWSRS